MPDTPKSEDSNPLPSSLQKEISTGSTASLSSAKPKLHIRVMTESKVTIDDGGDPPARSITPA